MYIGSLTPFDYDYLDSSLINQIIAAWLDLSQTVEHRLRKQDVAMVVEYEQRHD